MTNHDKDNTLMADQAQGDFLAALNADALEPYYSELTEDDAAREAAFHLAVALGRCRLFGADLGENDGTLPANVATGAAHHATRRAQAWQAAVARLAERFDTAADDLEAELLCIDLLECRQNCWAVVEALDEAILAAESGEVATVSQLKDAVEEFGQEARRFDCALEAEQSILSVVVGTGLLDEWRGSLAEEYREILPWYLDGTLERVATEVEQEALATMPDEVAWRKLREARAIAQGAGSTDPARTPSPKSVPLEELLIQLFRPAAAVAAATEQVKQPVAVFWKSPDGTCTALLLAVVPASDRPVELAVNFARTVTGDLAQQLIGEPVWLAGEEAVIDSSGRAIFRFQTQPDPRQGVELCVGRTREAWTPVPRQ